MDDLRRAEIAFAQTLASCIIMFVFGLVGLGAMIWITYCAPARADEVLEWEQPEPPEVDNTILYVDDVEFMATVQFVEGIIYGATIPDQTPVEWCWDVTAVNSAGRTPSANGPLCRRGVCSYDLDNNTIITLGDLGRQLWLIGSEGLAPIGVIARSLGTLCPSSSP